MEAPSDKRWRTYTNTKFDPRRTPEYIVKLLESIQVDHENSEGAVPRHRIPDFLLPTPLKHESIEEAGE
ncbi:MAG TPA: hypothetical protein VFC15_04415 [Candidatus Limnocylindrales bacterium]|jgi:hypothetical protein|nr:hypothetical protein [Candidatus Limnocylindrales bacterium]